MAECPSSGCKLTQMMTSGWRAAGLASSNALIKASTSDKQWPFIWRQTTANTINARLLPSRLSNLCQHGNLQKPGWSWTPSAGTWSFLPSHLGWGPAPGTETIYIWRWSVIDNWWGRCCRPTVLMCLRSSCSAGRPGAWFLFQPLLGLFIEKAHLLSCHQSLSDLLHSKTAVADWLINTNDNEAPLAPLY